jgi:hypothetical protein
VTRGASTTRCWLVLLYSTALLAATSLGGCVTDDDDGRAGDAGDVRPGDGDMGGDAPRDDLDAGDGGDTGGCEPNPEVPASDGRAQTVTFTVRNETDADWFVPELGWYCTAFGLAEQAAGGFVEVALALGFQCGCECPFPGPARVQQYVRLTPGEEATLTWNGLRLATVRRTLDCDAIGWPGGGCLDELAGYAVRAGAGVYRVRLPIEREEALADCSVHEQGASCLPSGGWMPGVLPNPAQMCPASDAVLEATFTLPEAGDVEVALSIE